MQWFKSKPDNYFNIFLINCFHIDDNVIFFYSLNTFLLSCCCCCCFYFYCFIAYQYNFGQIKIYISNHERSCVANLLHHCLCFNVKSLNKDSEKIF